MQAIIRQPPDRTLRFIVRDAADPAAALLYWLGAAKPSTEKRFADVIQRFAPLMQVVFAEERPGAFVNPNALRKAHQLGVTTRLIFLDDSYMDIWNESHCSDICHLYSCRRHTCGLIKSFLPWM